MVQNPHFWRVGHGFRGNDGLESAKTQSSVSGCDEHRLSIEARQVRAVAVGATVCLTQPLPQCVPRSTVDRPCERTAFGEKGGHLVIAQPQPVGMDSHGSRRPPKLAQQSQELIDLPLNVEMKVMETEPAIKGASVSNVGKPAKMETGLIVNVPPFINQGESIRIDTAEGTYLERVK